MIKIVYVVSLSILILGCSKPNSKATYGDTGLPKNCRAIIQTNIDEYKRIKSTHDDYELQMMDIDGVMDSIERNCGAHGYSWEFN